MLKLFIVSIFITGCSYCYEQHVEPWNGNEERIEDYHQSRIQDFIPKNETNSIKYPFYLLFGSYRLFLSSQDGPTCQYRPSCSHYTMKAVKRYGPLLGLIMGADRIQRCHPFHYGLYRVNKDSTHYIDPVEDHLLW